MDLTACRAFCGGISDALKISSMLVLGYCYVEQLARIRKSLALKNNILSNCVIFFSKIFNKKGDVEDIL